MTADEIGFRLGWLIGHVCPWDSTHTRKASLCRQCRDTGDALGLLRAYIQPSGRFLATAAVLPFVVYISAYVVLTPLHFISYLGHGEWFPTTVNTGGRSLTVYAWTPPGTIYARVIPVTVYSLPSRSEGTTATLEIGQSALDVTGRVVTSDGSTWIRILANGDSYYLPSADIATNPAPETPVEQVPKPIDKPIFKPPAPAIAETLPSESSEDEPATSDSPPAASPSSSNSAFLQLPGWIDGMLCNNVVLANLDRQVSYLYQTRLALLQQYPQGRAEALQQAQIVWLTARNDCRWSDDQINCLEQTYRLRLSELRQPLPTPINIPQDSRAVSIENTHTKPPYPAGAYRRGEQGTVQLSLDITPRGDVGFARIAFTSGSRDLDSAAQEWVVRHWKYRPAVQRGVAVSETVPAQVVFELKSTRGDGTNDTGTKSSPSLSARLTPYQPPPPYPPNAYRKGLEGVVSLHLTISGNGDVAAADVLISSGVDELDQAAADWARARWKYPPQDGNGLSVTTTKDVKVEFKRPNRN